MKNIKFAAAFLIAIVATTASSQVKSVTAQNNSPAKASRPRVLKQNVKANGHTDISPEAPTLQARANNPAETLRNAAVPTSKSPAGTRDGSNSPGPVDANNASASPSTSVSGTVVSAAPTEIYRVGSQDVLDIQLGGNNTKESTLFTVLESGELEYPLASAPVKVAGLTTAEIAGLLREQIRILENPRVVVNVRDYASHRVTITGFVAAPGQKSLRREAVPLFALLAEASVLREATWATIIRRGRLVVVADLKDPKQAATLVTSGDVIKVTGALDPTEFLFIGGAINSPGQKPYLSGITLTQAILASGGTAANAGDTVRVSRLGANGRLTTQEHKLRKIQSGKIPDPVLQNGDRIEVVPGK
jgi:protein involved in polysaccharide export with SLBB domain